MGFQVGDIVIALIYDKETKSFHNTECEVVLVAHPIFYKVQNCVTKLVYGFTEEALILKTPHLAENMVKFDSALLDWLEA